MGPLCEPPGWLHTDQAGGQRQQEVTATPWPGAGESNPTRHWGVHPESLYVQGRALPRPCQRLQAFGQVCMDSARASAAPRPLTPLGDLPASTCRAHRGETHSWVSRASHHVGLASSVLLALWGLLHHRRGWATTLAGAWLSFSVSWLGGEQRLSPEAASPSRGGAHSQLCGEPEHVSF